MSASTSCDTARLRALSPAVRRASSYSPPANAGDVTPRSSAATSALFFVVLVLIRPTLGLRRPIFLVVADEPLDMQPAEHLRREAARSQIFDLSLELALLPDDGIDLAEARLPQHAIELDAQIAERLFDQLARRGVDVPSERRRARAQLIGGDAVGAHHPRQPAAIADTGRLLHVDHALELRGQGRALLLEPRQRLL